MKNDIRFRQKVFESIEGLSCTSKLTGGMIKVQVFLFMKMEQEDIGQSLIGEMMKMKQNHQK